MKTSRNNIFVLLKQLFSDRFTLKEMETVLQKVNAGELQGVFVQALESAIESTKNKETYRQITK